MLVGYLIAAPQPGEAWGANVLVGSAGAAADRAETIRDLYGAQRSGGSTRGINGTTRSSGRPRRLARRLVAALVPAASRCTASRPFGDTPWP